MKHRRVVLTTGSAPWRTCSVWQMCIPAVRTRSHDHDLHVHHQRLFTLTWWQGHHRGQQQAQQPVRAVDGDWEGEAEAEAEAEGGAGTLTITRRFAMLQA